jgi:hypothetical protein
MWHYWLKIEQSSNTSTMPTRKQWSKIGDKLKYDGKNKHVINLKSIQSLDIITEENKKKVLGTVLGSGVGMALLGPLGAIAGLLIGGNKSLVNMLITLEGGEYFVATCTTKTHLMLLPYTIKSPPKEKLLIKVKRPKREKTHSIVDDTKKCPMCAETIKEKAKICRFCRHEF